VCCECCVLSGRGLCDGLFTRPEESDEVLCVSVRSWRLDNAEALAQRAVAPRGEKNNSSVYDCTVEDVE